MNLLRAFGGSKVAVCALISPIIAVLWVLTIFIAGLLPHSVLLSQPNLPSNPIISACLPDLYLFSSILSFFFTILNLFSPPFLSFCLFNAFSLLIFLHYLFFFYSKLKDTKNFIPTLN